MMKSGKEMKQLIHSLIFLILVDDFILNRDRYSICLHFIIILISRKLLSTDSKKKSFKGDAEAFSTSCSNTN